jgi:hypothetical protein
MQKKSDVPAELKSGKSNAQKLSELEMQVKNTSGYESGPQ